MSKAIYSFNWDFGRMGSLAGIFVSETAKVDSIVGKEIYFGEVLGKHSEIYGVLKHNHLKVLSQDQEFISKFEKIMGDGTISGYSPIDYYEDQSE